MSELQVLMQSRASSWTDYFAGAVGLCRARGALTHFGQETWIHSRDVFGTLVGHVNPHIAVAGAITSATASEAVISIAEVLSSGTKALSARAKLLESNPVAYLYELSESVEGRTRS